MKLSMRLRAHQRTGCGTFGPSSTSNTSSHRANRESSVTQLASPSDRIHQRYRTPHPLRHPYPDGSFTSYELPADTFRRAPAKPCVPRTHCVSDDTNSLIPGPPSPSAHVYGYRCLPRASPFRTRSTCSHSTIPTFSQPWWESGTDRVYLQGMLNEQVEEHLDNQRREKEAVFQSLLFIQEKQQMAMEQQHNMVVESMMSTHTEHLKWLQNQQKKQLDKMKAHMARQKQELNKHHQAQADKMQTHLVQGQEYLTAQLRQTTTHIPAPPVTARQTREGMQFHPPGMSNLSDYRLSRPSTVTDSQPDAFSRPRYPDLLNVEDAASSWRTWEQQDSSIPTDNFRSLFNSPFSLQLNNEIVSDTSARDDSTSPLSQLSRNHRVQKLRREKGVRRTRHRSVPVTAVEKLEEILDGFSGEFKSDVVGGLKKILLKEKLEM